MALFFVKNEHRVKALKFRPPKIPAELGLFNIIVACNSIYYLNRSFSFRNYFKNICIRLDEEAVFIYSLIGTKHSVLKNCIRENEDVIKLNNSAEKHKERKNQLVFHPVKAFLPIDYGLSIISQAEIYDNLDGEIRHLNFYFCKKN